jgi:hypothetical protein
MNILLEALAFPFKRSSMQMFLILCGLHLVEHFLINLPVLSIGTFTITGYLFAVQFNLIFTTGNGYKAAPSFPDFSDWYENILVPLLKVALVWALALAPALLIWWQVEIEEDSWLDWLPMLFVYFYLPIGLMIAAMDNISEVLNPITVFEAIRSAGMDYVWLVLGFGAWVIVSEELDTLFTGSWILGAIFGSYGLMFTGRLIGAVYRDRMANDIFEDIETPETNGL